MLAAASASAAERPKAVASVAPRTIAVDVGRVKGPHDKAFRLCVGAGRANEGLRADWQGQLATVQRECGFRYVRFHGLLHDDMGVYQETRDGKPVYNWQYIDELYDAILRTGMKPFVELGFMPSALASGTKTIFWWKGNVTPPKSYEKWEASIEALTRHFEERYGRDEVEDVVLRGLERAEPRLLLVRDAGGLLRRSTRARSARSSASRPTIASAVRPRPERPGSPSSCATARRTTCRSTSSRRTATTSTATWTSSASSSSVWSATRTSSATTSCACAGEIKASPRPAVELHFTEWSASYSSRDPVHDHYFSAPFILSRLKRVAGAAQSMSYWTFTDVFEEGGPGPTPFHGGFGLLNLQGLRKPSFYAYQFLNRLGDTELENSDAQSWACTSADGVQILLWDLRTPPTQDAPNQVYFKRDLPAARLGDVKLAVSGLPAGDYDLTLYRVGYRSNDVYADYMLMGSPSWLSQAQVARLSAQNDGSPILRRRVTLAAGAPLEHTLEMRENDVWLAIVTRR